MGQESVEVVEDVSAVGDRQLYLPVRIKKILGVKQGDEIQWVRLEGIQGLLVRKKEARESLKEERRYAPTVEMPGRVLGVRS